MKKILFLMMVALVIAGCSNEDDAFIEDNKEVPEVSVTKNATDIKVVSATLTGNVNSNAIEEDRLGVTNYGFIVSKNSNPTKENGWVIKGNDIKENEFTVRAMNLAPMTQYYYVSFFYDGSKYYYGKVLSFTTKDFNSSNLTAEANAGETSVNLKGYIDYEKIGYFDSYKAGFDIIDNAILYSYEIISEGTNFTYKTDKQNISAETNYNYYFFIEYVDKSNTKHILKGQMQSFQTTLELETGAIDLGLSVLWSGVNLGSTTPSGYGSYFAWGETVEKESYSLSNYLYTGIAIGIETDPNWPGKTLFYNITSTEYDAAFKILKDTWRMPSSEECKELVDNCKWKYMAYKKTWGFLITGKNGNRIFLPAAGRWNDTTHEQMTNYAYLWAGNCQSDKHAKTGKLCYALSASYTVAGLSKSTGQVFEAYYGFSIRPVKDISK